MSPAFAAVPEGAAASRVPDERTAVDKAIAVIEALGHGGGSGLGVTELARRTGLGKSTTHRVLVQLARHGIVVGERGTYRLGSRLYELGRAVLPTDHDAIRDQLIPSAAELYEATHETVHLAVLHGVQVVYLVKLYGHARVPSPSRIGGVAPAHATAVGKAMLAHDSDALARVLAAPLRRLTDRTVTDHAALLEQLDQVHASGVALEQGEAAPGLNCIAAPVLGADRRAVAALSVSVGDGRLDPIRHAAAVRRVAAAATRLARARSFGAGRAAGAPRVTR